MNAAQEVIAQALALSEVATDAPWQQNGMNGVHTRNGSCIATTHRFEDEQRKADAEFIAAARTLLPALAKALGDVLALADDLDDPYPHIYPDDIRSAITAALSAEGVTP